MIKFRCDTTASENEGDFATRKDPNLPTVLEYKEHTITNFTIDHITCVSVQVYRL